YYRKYVKGYSIVAGPLFALTRKYVAFVWDVNSTEQEPPEESAPAEGSDAT
ncbi:unnamed protein product, partial [Sphagnum troendelagicum]